MEQPRSERRQKTYPARKRRRPTMHDHTHALTNQMIIVPSTNLRRRHATQREGAVSPCIDGWMDGCLLHSHVRSRSGSRRPRLQPPDDGRKQLYVVPSYCVRARGRHGTSGFFCRVAFVAFDRSTIICAPHSGRGPLPLPRPSRPSPYPIELRTRSMPCMVTGRDGRSM